MYTSPRRRGGSNELADARARQVPAEAHRGSYREFLRRHERESAKAVGWTRRERAKFDASLLSRTADSRNLRRAIDYLASEAGTAPGPNGLTFKQLDHSQRWELARGLGSAISRGTYRPGPDRKAQSPKSSGNGTRTLRIQDIEDRVVQRAIVQIVQPLLDPQFLPTSFGFRPKLGREQALAAAEHLATTGSRWTWVTDDIRDAFDHVPHGRLLQIVLNRLQAADLTEFIGVVISNQERQGLRQGGAISPLLVNLYLDHLLDRTWDERMPGVPLLRYADDLLVLAEGQEEARTAHDHLRRTLRSAGMTLKGDPSTAIHHLRTGKPVEWIGIAMCKGPSGLEYRPTGRTWNSLKVSLKACHKKPLAPIRAIETIEGWIGQLGPCRPHLDTHGTHARIADLAAEFSFEEIPDAERTTAILDDAHDRWTSIRERTHGNAGSSNSLSHKTPLNPPFVRGEANLGSPPYEGGVGGGSGTMA